MLLRSLHAMASRFRPRSHGYSLWLHHIGIQTTFEGTATQTGQDLIAQIAPAQVNMLRLQQQGPLRARRRSHTPRIVRATRRRAPRVAWNSGISASRSAKSRMSSG